MPDFHFAICPLDGSYWTCNNGFEGKCKSCIKTREMSDKIRKQLPLDKQI